MAAQNEHEQLTDKQRRFCEEYSLSESGAIYSIPRKNKRGQKIGGHFLSATILPSGYACVGLTISGNKRMWYVHRLVAINFIPNPENKPEVNHKDGNKANNHVSNLEWATSSENKLHAHRTGLVNLDTPARRKAIQKTNRNKRIINSEMMKFINSMIGIVSQAEIARRLNVSPQTIMRQIKNNGYGGIDG